MKIKLIVWLFLCLLFCKTGFTQTHLPNVNPIKIGDKVPDYPLTKLLNYPSPAVKLNGFNNKILILDFWNFTCSACIGSWPKLLKLQKEFQDQVQIVLVNTEQSDTNKVKDFVRKREKAFGYKMDLLMANGDKQLRVLFPHYSLPHVVWVDKSGTVKYITGGPELNELTIRKMIANDNMNLVTKTDERVSADFSKPLFINGNGVGADNGANAILTSIINPYSPDIPTYAGFYSNDHLSYGYISNHSILAMIRVLWGGEWHEWAADKTPVSFPAAKTIIEMNDSTKIINSKDGSRSSRYTIQLRIAKNVSVENLQKKMLADLEEYFGFTTLKEKRTKKCLILSRNKQPLTIYQNGKKRDAITKFKLDINNVSVPQLLNLLGSRLASFNVNLGRYPIIDETNFKGLLGTINFDATNMEDINLVSQMLSTHGLEFSLQEREVDVLVIRDNDNL